LFNSPPAKNKASSELPRCYALKKKSFGESDMVLRKDDKSHK